MFVSMRCGSYFLMLHSATYTSWYMRCLYQAKYRYNSHPCTYCLCLLFIQPRRTSLCRLTDFFYLECSSYDQLTDDLELLSRFGEGDGGGKLLAFRFTWSIRMTCMKCGKGFLQISWSFRWLKILCRSCSVSRAPRENINYQICIKVS